MTKYIQFPPELKIAEKSVSKGYTLTSLIAYMGSGYSGHYYAFRKRSKESEMWYYVSDKSRCCGS